MAEKPVDPLAAAKERVKVKLIEPADPSPQAKEPANANLKQPADPLAEAKERSKANLKQIAKAFEKYKTANGHFPIGLIDPKWNWLGLSWRVQILPYLDDPQAAKLFKQFRLVEPWDSEHNNKLLAAMPKVYAPVRGQTEEGFTFYQGFADHMLEANGKEWPKERLVVLSGLPGAFFPDPRSRVYNYADEMKPTADAGLPFRSRKDVPDGTFHTFLVAEAGEAVPWTKPQDIPYRRESDKPFAGTCPKLGGLFGGDFHVVMVYGTIYYIKEDVPAEKLRPFITFAGGEVPDYFSIGQEPPDWSLVKPFVGTWVRTSFEENGKKQPFDDRKTFTLKFTKDNKVVYSENETVPLEGRFWVWDQDTGTPNQGRWDWKSGVEDRVIYRFEGDNKLVTCWTHEGTGFPTRFETGSPKGGTFLAAWKRVAK